LKNVTSLGSLASFLVALNALITLISSSDVGHFGFLKPAADQHKNQPNNKPIDHTVNNSTDKRNVQCWHGNKHQRRNQVTRKQRHRHSVRCYTKQDKERQKNRPATHNQLTSQTALSRPNHTLQNSRTNQTLVGNS